jgi:NTP pyrophosphatase (non-canonical NTP hydrolase)
MDANNYQAQAARTLIADADVPAFAAHDLTLIWNLLALTQEAAAANELGKKGIFHQHGVNGPALWDTLQTAAELGTVLLDTLQTKSRTESAGTFTPVDVRILWNLTGLAGEVGEVIQTCKHAILDGEINRDTLIKELGDVAWYLAALCTVLGIPLSTVLETNLAKLQARYPQGWDQSRSRHEGAQ